MASVESLGLNTYMFCMHPALRQAPEDYDMSYITNEWVTLFIPALDRSFWCGQMLLQLPEGQVQKGVWGKSSRYFTMQTNAMFTGLFLQTNVEDLKLRSHATS